MDMQSIIRIGRNGVLVLAVALAAGWLAFVPSASEPAYAFVSAWGEKGGASGQFQDPTGIAVAGDECLGLFDTRPRVSTLQRSPRS